MCENEKSLMAKLGAAVSGYFATPTMAKGSPPFIVTGANMVGLTVNDLLQLLTLVYTLCLLIGGIPKTWAGVQFLLSLKDRKKRKEAIEERTKE